MTDHTSPEEAASIARKVEFNAGRAAIPVDYANPRSDRRADRILSAETHYLGTGSVFGRDERTKLFELLARLALPRLADTHTLYEVAHDVDLVDGDTTFFYAVNRLGALMGWSREMAEAHLLEVPEGTLYIITVRRNAQPDRHNAYVTIDTTWRNFR